MVQGKVKLNRVQMASGKSRPRGQQFVPRKAAPHLSSRTSSFSHSTTSAIGRRIEQLMAARLSHEGGTLSIIPKPTNVEKYESGRGKTNIKQTKQLHQATMARRARQKKEGIEAENNQNENNSKSTASSSTTTTGKKRKRGLAGITKIGDEWFDEADAALEQLRYESADEEEDDEENTVQIANDINESAPHDEKEQQEDPTENKNSTVVTLSATSSLSSSRASAASFSACSSSDSSLPVSAVNAFKNRVENPPKSLSGSWFNNNTTKKQKAVSINAVK